MYFLKCLLFFAINSWYKLLTLFNLLEEKILPMNDHLTNNIIMKYLHKTKIMNKQILMVSIRRKKIKETMKHFGA